MTGRATTLARVLRRSAARYPRLIDLSLGRMRALLTSLGEPQHSLGRVIHVAGSNGKGSTIAFLRAFLEAAGMKVNAYTSPHLRRFRERIVVGGVELDDDSLAEWLTLCERRCGGRPITFFEITTAAALAAFAANRHDATLLETGMGGRCDATNVVVAPQASVITPLSLDHTHYLGATLPLIAAEKAGIFKSGCLAVSAPQPPSAMSVLRRCAGETGVASLLAGGRHWRVSVASDGGLLWEGGGRRLSLPPPALAGAHQYVNAGVAIACLQALDWFEGGQRCFAAGLRRVCWPGRLQRLRDGPLARRLPPRCQLWLDGGHNPAAAEALAVQADSWRSLPLHVIIGMTAHRDVAAFAAPLARRAASWRAVGVDGLAPAASCAASLAAAGLKARACASLAAALDDLAATLNNGAAARVLVCGSLYLVGEALSAAQGTDARRARAALSPEPAWRGVGQSCARARSTQLNNSLRGNAPTRRAAARPFLKKISVGMPLTP